MRMIIMVLMMMVKMTLAAIMAANLLIFARPAMLSTGQLDLCRINKNNKRFPSKVIVSPSVLLCMKSSASTDYHLTLHFLHTTSSEMSIFVQSSSNRHPFRMPFSNSKIKPCRM